MFRRKDFSYFRTSNTIGARRKNQKNQMIRATENALTTAFIFIISKFCDLPLMAGFSDKITGHRRMVSATIRNVFHSLTAPVCLNAIQSSPGPLTGILR
ncbi:MAG: hypothetical protein OXH06_19965 [Gemmatimonadetes bacterium]|nr:hypothetical protein [Gemmatimonadota bacterium]